IFLYQELQLCREQLCSESSFQHQKLSTRYPNEVVQRKPLLGQQHLYQQSLSSHASECLLHLQHEVTFEYQLLHGNKGTASQCKWLGKTKHYLQLWIELICPYFHFQLLQKKANQKALFYFR